VHGWEYVLDRRSREEFEPALCVVDMSDAERLEERVERVHEKITDE